MAAAELDEGMVLSSVLVFCKALGSMEKMPARHYSLIVEPSSATELAPRLLLLNFGSSCVFG